MKRALTGVVLAGSLLLGCEGSIELGRGRVPNGGTGLGSGGSGGTGYESAGGRYRPLATMSLQ